MVNENEWMKCGIIFFILQENFQKVIKWVFLMLLMKDVICTQKVKFKYMSITNSDSYIWYLPQKKSIVVCLSHH